MRNCVIPFEQWLSNNYPEEVADPEYGCLQCDGTGFIDAEPNEEDTCLLCMGSGSNRYSEYIELAEIDEEKLRKWEKLN